MIIPTLFKLFPECLLKLKLRCIYWNSLENNIFKIWCKKGIYYANFKDNIIVKFYQNPYHYLDSIRGYLKYYKFKKGDVVIDAGGYMGDFGLYAAKKVGKNGKVICFEPLNSLVNALNKNIKLNNIKNIIVVKKGLWNKNKQVDFFIGKSLSSSRMFYTENIGKIKVNTVKLDDELERLKIDKVDFIKMDIEGAEIGAIKGAKNTLKNNNCNLAIASYHIVNNEQTYIKLEKLLRDFGYAVYTSHKEHLTTYGEKKYISGEV